MTVHVMERSMDENELRDWAIYLNEETPDVAELQTAILSNMIASYMGVKNTKYENFLVRKPREQKVDDKPISNEAIKAVFRTFVTK